MERIYSLKVQEIAPLIEDLAFNSSDFMILENIDDIKFDHYHATKFEDWEKGYIFSNDREFKWRKFEKFFLFVYSGENILIENQDHFITSEVDDDEALLWGQRSPQMSDFEDNQYIELPIPRVLTYPIKSSFRIKMKLKIHKNKENKIIGYRFAGLSEEVKNESV